MLACRLVLVARLRVNQSAGDWRRKLALSEDKFLLGVSQLHLQIGDLLG